MRYCVAIMCVIFLGMLANCSTKVMVSVDSAENYADLTVDIEYKAFFREYLSDLELMLGPFFNPDEIESELATDPRFIGPRVYEDGNRMQVSMGIYPFFETMRDFQHIDMVNANPQSLAIFLHSGLIAALLSQVPSLSVIAQGFMLDEQASPFTLRESLTWALEEYASRNEIARSFDTSDVTFTVHSVNPLYDGSTADFADKRSASFVFNPFSFENNKEKIAIEFSSR